MSWEWESASDPVVEEAPTAVPRVVLLGVGFVLGLVATGGTPFVYYWLFAPVFPVIAGAFVVVLAMRFRQLLPVAEGMFAAALFGIVFVIIALIGLGNLLSR